MILKRIKSLLLSAMFVFTLVPWAAIGMTEADAAETEIETTTSTAMPFRELTADELVAEMGVGWNYGNRFDSGGGESGWGNPKVTQDFFKKVHNLGFNTIRLPVTWDRYIGKSEPYTVDEQLLDRVQDVVDYIIAEGMYVSINMHHDGKAAAGWISEGVMASYPSGDPEKWQTCQDRYYSAWKQIAERFKDYDEHLLFEAMNEVSGNDATATGLKRDTAAIVTLNQLFTNAIRETGSNNTHRWLIIGGRYTNIDTSADKSNGLKFPDDPYNATNKFMFQIHDYDQYLGLTNPPSGEYSRARARAYASQIQKVVDGFTSQGIPVWFGEFGAGKQDGINEYGEQACAYYFETMIAYMSETNMVGCIWDNGSMGNGVYGNSTTNDNFALIDRMTGDAYRPKAIEAMMRANEFYKDIPLTQIFSAIPGDDKNYTPVIPVTSIELSDDEVNLRTGSVYTIETTSAPSDTNDPLIWSSDDSSIATVYKGKIIAKNVGQTIVRVYAQSNLYDGNDVEKEIVVTVYPDTSKANADGDIVVADSLSVTGDLWSSESGFTWNQSSGVAQPNAFIEVTTKGLRRNDHLTFTSSDPSVATVNGVGKVVGISEGTAYINVGTQSGLQKQVLVTVNEGMGIANTLTAGEDIALDSSASEKEISVTASAAGKIYFVSSDLSVAFVETNKAVDVIDGKATVKIIAAGEGTAEITAYSENGDTCQTKITVGAISPEFDDERKFYETEPSDIAPQVEIIMDDTAIRHWLVGIGYNVTTSNPDVTEELKVSIYVECDGWEIPVVDNCFIPENFGNYTVKVRAEDEFGNSSFATKEISVVAGQGPDETAPTVTLDMDTTVEAGQKQEIVFTVSSENTSLPENASFNVQISVKTGDEMVEVTEENGKYYFIPTAEGSYEITITAADGYGNTTTAEFVLQAETTGTENPGDSADDSSSGVSGGSSGSSGGCGSILTAGGFMAGAALFAAVFCKKRRN